MQGRRCDHERREQLLQDVAVGPEQEPFELCQIMADQVELDAVAYAAELNGLRPGTEPDHILGGKYVDGTQVDIRVHEVKPYRCAPETVTKATE